MSPKLSSLSTNVDSVARITINQIAELAGVSKSAVSYALNGKPGVSPATRDRILKVAQDLSWRPSAPARALAGRKVGTIGLVLNRPARLLGLEPFYMEFISGIHEVLSPRDISLVFKVVSCLEDEEATYRMWTNSHVVDGVILTDLTENDPRPENLRRLGLPAIVVGPQPDQESVAIWTADAEAMREVVRYLAALGHQRIARVAGTATYLHTQLRSAALAEEMVTLGLAPATTLFTDFSQEQGMQATRRILASSPRPTAIIYDNDIMAAVGLAVAEEMGMGVPGDVSIVAWDDSLLSRLARPPLTSTSVDVGAYSMAVVTALLELINGGAPVSGPSGEAGLTVRSSTAPPKPGA